LALPKSDAAGRRVLDPAELASLPDPGTPRVVLLFGNRIAR
jgi:hypothetical protein